MAEGVGRRCITVALRQWRRNLGGEVCGDEFGSTTRFYGAALGSDPELDRDAQASELESVAWCIDWTGRRHVAGERWTIGSKRKLVVEFSWRWCGDTCGLCVGGWFGQ